MSSTASTVTPGARAVPGVTPFRCECCGLTGYRGSCAQCGRTFTARNGTAVYCSARCRVEAHRAEQ